MLVKNWMIKPVITVDVNATMQQAIDLMMDHSISILPVLENDKLVGIVTDRDIKRASPSSAVLLEIQHVLSQIAGLAVGAVMSPHVVTVPLDFTVEETAQLLLEKGFSGVPVVDDQGSVQGIITKTDVFKVLIAVSGVARKGVQFALLLKDEAGKIKEITDLILTHDVRIVSFMNSYELAPAGHVYVYIRMYHPERDKMFRVIDELRRKNRMIYWVDNKENVRKIFE
ncbi:MAG TPA: CBS and ACT domain-containing protein [Desulfomonilaceae bacterium]|nr:CBS and ACT domain-containing protein [Desulfomonilaceae bacterium]